MLISAVARIESKGLKTRQHIMPLHEGGTSYCKYILSPLSLHVCLLCLKIEEPTEIIHVVILNNSCLIGGRATLIRAGSNQISSTF